MRIDEADRPVLAVAAVALLVVGFVLTLADSAFLTAVGLLCLLPAYWFIFAWEDARLEDGDQA